MKHNVTQSLTPNIILIPVTCDSLDSCYLHHKTHTTTLDNAACNITNIAFMFLQCVASNVSQNEPACNEDACFL
jgi:hypothetical protein